MAGQVRQPSTSHTQQFFCPRSKHANDNLTGSFLEFLPLLDILQNRHSPENLPYHLIVPSLPGYTFSSPPPLQRDFRVEDVARILKKLAISLGFGDGFIVQGGDVGSKVARVLAAEHKECKGSRR